MNIETLQPLPDLMPKEGVETPEMDTLAKRAANQSPGQLLAVAGGAGSATAWLAARLRAHTDERVVVLVADDAAAFRMLDDLRFLAGAPDEVGILLAPEAVPYAEVNPDLRAMMSRLGTLTALAAGKLPWVVVSAGALLRKVLPCESLRSACMSLRTGETVERDALRQRLIELGYQRVPLVEDPGTFALRGALLDLWPVTAQEPSRLEFDFEELRSIQPFDPSQQTVRGGAPVQALAIGPAREQWLDQESLARARAQMDALIERFDYATHKANQLREDVLSGRVFFGADGYLPAFFPALQPLLEYLRACGALRLVVEEPGAVLRTLREERQRVIQAEVERGNVPHFDVDAFCTDEPALQRQLGELGGVGLSSTLVLGSDDPMERALGGVLASATAAPLDLAASDHAALAPGQGAPRGGQPLLPLLTRLEHYREHGVRVQLVVKSSAQAERLRALLEHRKVTCVAPRPLSSRGLSPSDALQVELQVGSLGRGLLLPADRLALITEEELFGSRAHKVARRTKRESSEAFTLDMRSLQPGDLVVHQDHGIGRYLGLSQRKLGGVAVDLIAIEYAAGDKLYLPVYRLNQVQKYAGGEASAAKLDRLGGQSFAKVKSRASKAARELADELLRLYAEREAARGPELPPLDDDYRLFEATFPYEETADQARAIEDVQADLDKSRPMDRLVCGDVGFGKTEVALRAAYRVAAAGKQVAVLCPTTVLAQQHFRTFQARMADSALNLRVLSRFQSKKEQDETIAALKAGRCDVVIGTHRLLSKDVHFKDLGLLVVDEEQRFGVLHKERIKQLRKNVHILTLSATPIPRTLQMAVSGVRELSLITTPPMARRAVRTVVTRHDERVMVEAIERELSRGGQVFYVYGRIEGLYERAERLRQLMPGLRVAVGHGQMSARTKAKDSSHSETELERTMLDFVDGQYDVLVATAIVESGLDIPRANTILIDRADLFGLAQLYQLRGRVGRSKERAYCYLLVPPLDAMTDDARARIEAIERHSELGSGFKVASLDLELRGAGDLLGGEQSGNVASVGFELFVQLLHEAVSELRGEEVVHEVDPELSFDVSALLPDGYVDEVGLRLGFYKRLAQARTRDDVERIAAEIENRFGPPPPEARSYFALMALKTELRALRALGCEANGSRVTLHLRADTPLDPAKVLQLVHQSRGLYKLTPDMRLSRRFEVPLSDGLAAAQRVLLELAPIAGGASG